MMSLKLGGATPDCRIMNSNTSVFMKYNKTVINKQINNIKITTNLISDILIYASNDII